MAKRGGAVIAQRGRGLKQQNASFFDSIERGYGNGQVDLIGSRADALASTANFLRANGWRPGAGYGPGEPNFRALQAWNAAGDYQQAIAIIGQQIDGN